MLVTRTINIDKPQSQAAWVPTPASLLISCVTFSKLLNHSITYFHKLNCSNNNTDLVGFVRIKCINIYKSFRTVPDLKSTIYYFYYYYYHFDINFTVKVVLRKDEKAAIYGFCLKVA